MVEAVPIVLILVFAYILTQQETQYLLWTGGITAFATLYWALYLRPRKDTRWLVSIPEDDEAPAEKNPAAVAAPAL